MSNEDKKEQIERAFVRGRREMAASFLRKCNLELNPEEKDKAILIIERDEAVAMLRQVCENHGDNDWDDDWNLSDVIEKHLWGHLE